MLYRKHVFMIFCKYESRYAGVTYYKFFSFYK